MCSIPRQSSGDCSSLSQTAIIPCQPPICDYRAVTSHLQHPTPVWRGKSREETAKLLLLVMSLQHQGDSLQLPRVPLLQPRWQRTREHPSKVQRQDLAAFKEHVSGQQAGNCQQQGPVYSYTFTSVAHFCGAGDARGQNEKRGLWQ